jgi:hypothetical protein
MYQFLATYARTHEDDGRSSPCLRPRGSAAWIGSGTRCRSNWRIVLGSMSRRSPIPVAEALRRLVSTLYPLVIRVLHIQGFGKSGYIGYKPLFVLVDQQKTCTFFVFKKGTRPRSGPGPKGRFRWSERVSRGCTHFQQKRYIGGPDRPFRGRIRGWRASQRPNVVHRGQLPRPLDWAAFTAPAYCWKRVGSGSLLGYQAPTRPSRASSPARSVGPAWT